jgi:uncharacterized membrane protein (DUF441 family)
MYTYINNGLQLDKTQPSVFINSVKNNISLANIVWVVKSRGMRCAGHLALMVEERGVNRVSVGKPEGKRPLGRPRPR